MYEIFYKGKPQTSDLVLKKGKAQSFFYQLNLFNLMR